MPNVDWTWFFVGIVFAMFILPYVTSRIATSRGGKNSARTV